MSQDFTATNEQYVCDECGRPSPIASEHCPECGSPMSALHDEKPAETVKTEGSDESLENVALDDDAPSSLEALQSKEQEESDKEYQNDTYGNE